MQYAETYNFGYQEYGINIVGQNFMVFEHEDKDIVMSFMLIGTGGNVTHEYEYECVYSDIK
jgi:hypothetical protein